MSKTVKFEIGDRVLTIIDSKMYKGTIERLHLDLPRPVAIIDLDDGTKGKFYITNIIPEPKESKEVKEEPEKVQEEKTESQDGAKVITREAFNNAVNYVTSSEGMLDGKDIDLDPFSLMIIGMTVMIVGMKIGDDLYQDKKEIEITKDQLKDVIKEKTNPRKVAEYVDNKMSIVDVFPISMLSALLLLKAVYILFDDSKND